MTVIKNLKDHDPANWVCAGCPLPSMMGLEKRRGKNKPVIVKYLVDLEGPMFHAYKLFKDAWKIYDCYQSPGPIQFNDPTCLDVPFMVKAPDIDQLQRDLEEWI